MKKFFTHPRTIPFAFLLIILAAYGLLIPWLGFYWDDWVYTWFARTLGPSGLIKALVNDRVFLAVVYAVNTTLFGQNPLVWQIFALLARWLSVLALWWSLKQVWPRQARQVTWVAVLFAVYPGFMQHWISVVYSQAYLLLAATLASLGIMAYAVRHASGRRYWLLTGLAILLSVISLFSTEYFFGIELLRPLLLWFVIAGGFKNWRKDIPAVLIRWAPYAAELAFFAFWRTFLFHSEGYQVQAVNELNNNAAATLSGLLHYMINAAFTSGYSAWAQIFSTPGQLGITTRTAQFYWAVGLVSLVLLIAYFWKLRYSNESSEDEPQSEQRWSIQAIVLGAAGLLVSSVPFWAGDLPFNLFFPWNRFTLAMMFSASLLVVGVVEFFIRTGRQKMILLSILTALSIAFQFQVANTYRRDQDNMRAFFQQMSWRMPGLKPGTLLMTYQLPFTYYSDNSLSAPLNWVYASDLRDTQMPYILTYLRTRLKNTLPGLDPNTPVKIDFRAMTFFGNTSQSVVFQYSPPNCLRVLDPVYENSNIVPNLHGDLIKALPLTNFDQIQPGSDASLPQNLFGAGKTGSWCYYFEKAQLARQLGDWQQVSDLAGQVSRKKLKPNDQTEWLVFIDGYAHSGKIKNALSLTQSVAKTEQRYRPALCALWSRIQSDPQVPVDVQKSSTGIQTELQCSKITQPNGQ